MGFCLSGVVRCSSRGRPGSQWAHTLWHACLGALRAEPRAGASSRHGDIPENPSKTSGKRAKTTKSKKNRPLRGRGAGGAHPTGPPRAGAPEGRSAVGAHQRAWHDLHDLHRRGRGRGTPSLGDSLSLSLAPSLPPPPPSLPPSLPPSPPITLPRSPETPASAHEGRRD